MGDIYSEYLHSSVDGNYLEHHGIDGQKWGVRRGPPYPIGSGSKTFNGQHTRSDLIKRRNRHDKYTDWHEKWMIRSNSVLKARDKEAETLKKNYIKNRAKNCQIDEKTGLYEKDLYGKKYTSDVDVQFVNIEKNSPARGPRNNCALCSLTYDLRRRGSEVIANNAVMGYTTEEVQKWFKDFKIDTDKDPMYVRVDTKESREQYAKNFANKTKELSKLKNARGMMFVCWGYDCRRPYGGHAMAWEVNDGVFTIRDGQTGKTYINNKKSASSKQTISNLNELRDGYSNIDDIVNSTAIFQMFRTDNLEPDYDLIRREALVV